MNKVFRNFVNYGFSLTDAVKFTSTNAARLMGLSDVGSLEVGKRADIMIADDKFGVDMTILNGEIRYEKGE